MAYVSQSVLADLETPHAIFRSPITLSILSLLTLGAAGGCLFGVWMVWQGLGPKGPIPASLWTLLGIAAAFVLLFLWRMLPKWLALREPALTISKQGIAISGKELVPWAEILGNTWRSQSYNGIPIGAGIEIQAGWGMVTCEAFTLKCRSAEYLRLCELYRQAAMAPLPDATAGAGQAGLDTGRAAQPAPAAEPDTIGDLTVRRRFPAGAWVLLIGGLAVAAGLIVMIVMILQSQAGPRYPGFANKGSGLSIDMTYALFFVIAALAVAGFGLRPAWAWLVDPKSLVIGRTELRYGDRRIPYTAITSLAQRAGRRVTRITAQDGPPVTLRWAIWADSPVWTGLLAQRSQRHLREGAWQALGQGGRVAFGKGVALDRQTLYLKGHPIPLGAITDLHVQTGATNGVEYRTLRVRAAGREHSIDEAKVENAPLFHDLVQALLEPGGRPA